MESQTKLNDDEVEHCLTTLNNWKLLSGKLHREYKFNDFKEAFAFMSKVAEFAEQIQHHPEWYNVYSKITIDLCTHDVDGISEKDIMMAQEMNRLAP